MPNRPKEAKGAEIQRPARPVQGDAPVSHLPLPHQVASRIRDMIIQDVLAPGDRIRERTLAEELNVSRTPMREAFKMLATEGLVELLPNRGAIVAAPGPEEVRDMLRVLGALEALAGELACVEATDDEISELKAIHYEMLAAYTRKSRLEYFKLNQKIHLGIVARSRNEALIEVHNRLNARLYRVRYQSNLRGHKWHTAIEEHEEILDALVNRESERLAVLMRAHLGSAWAKVSESMGVSASTRPAESE